MASRLGLRPLKKYPRLGRGIIILQHGGNTDNRLSAGAGTVRGDGGWARSGEDFPDGQETGKSREKIVRVLPGVSASATDTKGLFDGSVSGRENHASPKD